jgi:hypothetical protein
MLMKLLQVLVILTFSTIASAKSAQVLELHCQQNQMPVVDYSDRSRIGTHTNLSGYSSAYYISSSQIDRQACNSPNAKVSVSFKEFPELGSDSFQVDVEMRTGKATLKEGNGNSSEAQCDVFIWCPAWPKGIRYL